MPVLSPSEDIKSLIERHAGILIVGKPSRVRGILEYHSACPFCGGHDRFITRPETGWFTCSIRASGCGRHGDMLDFLKEYCNMTMIDALQEIGLDPSELDFVLDEREQERTLAREALPPKKWQERGEVWLHALRRRSTLFHRFYPHAATHVHDRGLKDEMIKQFDLQYMPFSHGWFHRENAELWGLDPDHCEEGKIWLPEGIWIPWYQDGQLLKIEVRRLLKVKQKYMEMRGSAEPALFNLDAVTGDKPVVLCESALCAVAGTQEAGDLVAFVATGGAGKGRDARLIEKLKHAPYTLMAMDDDPAGDSAAHEWRVSLPRSVRLRPWKKDISDMLVAGDNVREWVVDGMDFYEATRRAKTLSVPDPHTP